jgi:hypothetical protein
MFAFEAPFNTRMNQTGRGHRTLKRGTVGP